MPKRSCNSRSNRALLKNCWIRASSFFMARGLAPAEESLALICSIVLVNSRSPWKISDPRGARPSPSPGFPCPCLCVRPRPWVPIHSPRPPSSVSVRVRPRPCVPIHSPRPPSSVFVRVPVHVPVTALPKRNKCNPVPTLATLIYQHMGVTITVHNTPVTFLGIPCKWSGIEPVSVAPTLPIQLSQLAGCARLDHPGYHRTYAKTSVSQLAA